MNKYSKILYSTLKNSKSQTKNIFKAIVVIASIGSINVIAKEESTEKLNLIDVNKISDSFYQKDIKNEGNKTDNINTNFIAYNSNLDTKINFNNNSTPVDTAKDKVIENTTLEKSQNIKFNTNSLQVKNNLSNQITLLSQKLTDINLKNPVVNAISTIDNTSKELSQNIVYSTKKLAKSMQQGLASWYGKQFHGKKTASGERFNMFAYTAAHRTLPLGSYARITNSDNHKTAIVKITDRGPYAHKRLIDLSFAAAKDLDLIKRGTAHVKIEPLNSNNKNKSADIVTSNEYNIETSANTISIK